MQTFVATTWPLSSRIPPKERLLYKSKERGIIDHHVTILEHRHCERASYIFWKLPFKVQHPIVFLFFSVPVEYHEEHTMEQ